MNPDRRQAFVATFNQCKFLAWGPDIVWKSRNYPEEHWEQGEEEFCMANANCRNVYIKYVGFLKKIRKPKIVLVIVIWIILFRPFWIFQNVNKEQIFLGLAEWSIPLTPALRRLRQVELNDFESSLFYVESSRHSNNLTQKQPPPQKKPCVWNLEWSEYFPHCGTMSMPPRGETMTSPGHHYSLWWGVWYLTAWHTVGAQHTITEKKNVRPHTSLIRMREKDRQSLGPCWPARLARMTSSRFRNQGLFFKKGAWWDIIQAYLWLHTFTCRWGSYIQLFKRAYHPSPKVNIFVDIWLVNGLGWGLFVCLVFLWINLVM